MFCFRSRPSPRPPSCCSAPALPWPLSGPRQRLARWRPARRRPPSPWIPLQALLIAVGYYLSNSPWLFGLAYFTLFRPLVAGLFVGVILGDPAQGTLIGATINLAYLGFISAGGTLPSDPGLAGWVGTALAIAGHLDPAQALALAVPIGLLGTLIFNLRMTGDSVFAHWVDARADAADISGVALMNWLPGQAWLFLISVVPVFLLAYNGTDFVVGILNGLPAWVLNGLSVAGGLLPAIGIALNMRFIFRGAVIPYFFLGYLVMVASDQRLEIVLVAALGLVLAYLHVTFVTEARRHAVGPAEETPPVGPQAGREVAAADGVALSPTSSPRGPVRLTRGDVLRSWILWTFFSHANYSYERLQGTGFAHAMTPIIRRLYRTDDEIRAALRRHLVFFNTEPNLGNVIHGAVIAMEEQRANGAPIDDDAINAVKSGLMGPLAGIGDTISQGTLTPIFLAVGIGIAGASAATGTAIAGRTGNPLGAIVYLLLIGVSIVLIGYLAWMQGYARGRTFVTDMLRSGAMERDPDRRGRPREHRPGRAGRQVRGRLRGPHDQPLRHAPQPADGPPGQALPRSPAAPSGGRDLVSAAASEPDHLARHLPGDLAGRRVPLLRDRPEERRRLLVLRLHGLAPASLHGLHTAVARTVHLACPGGLGRALPSPRLARSFPQLRTAGLRPVSRGHSPPRPTASTTMASWAALVRRAAGLDRDPRADGGRTLGHDEAPGRG